MGQAQSRRPPDDSACPVAAIYIVACSFLAEPKRRNFNAVMIAGAGAAYLNGGFGPLVRRGRFSAR
jgi:hypothetical protein